MSTRDNAHNTALPRRRSSAPMKYLADNGLIQGRALDYGCGHGTDAHEYDMESYDPHYCPDMPRGLFNTITCNYVLNVIESPLLRCGVLADIRCRLDVGGKAYITVRNDKRALRGVTKIGTWQCHVILRLPVVRQGSGYVMYLLTPDDDIDANMIEQRTY